METTFCMESGQVKTGDDADDTYIKMLQEISRITVPMAHGIATGYPNVVRLVKGLNAHGPLALEDVRVRQDIKLSKRLETRLTQMLRRKRRIKMERSRTEGLDQLPARDCTVSSPDLIPRLPMFRQTSSPADRRRELHSLRVHIDKSAQAIPLKAFWASRIKGIHSQDIRSITGYILLWACYRKICTYMDFALRLFSHCGLNPAWKQDHRESCAYVELQTVMIHRRLASKAGKTIPAACGLTNGMSLKMEGPRRYECRLNYSIR